MRDKEVKEITNMREGGGGGRGGEGGGGRGGKQVTGRERGQGKRVGRDSARLSPDLPWVCTEISTLHE